MIHGDLIVLDINADSYSFLLADEFVPNVSQAIHGTGPGELDDALGLIGRNSDLADGLSPPTVPQWRDLPEIQPACIVLRDVLRFGFALLYTGWHFVGRPLEHVIRIGSRETTNADRHDVMSYANYLDIFDRLSIWLPERGDCLFRSFFLINFLKAADLSADWVFAVHLYPFRAHCWLAVGDHVVGDSAHRVLAFQPILTVGSGGAR